ncbi:uncharacterized protein FA14DRAFT_186996 [Meira miltonrushii]|uniref:Prolyl endopeptidase n=1 Tax=Meira miltonrushii TaxID=1280837 RepID=A0A316VGQ5_9BASI|nr:uncharacterized protein FA14DRAFT_186996 [Meira miltonrushii]PWN36819.1 hypothetical protein FA14DRAFT_186996 [Meira miltonrushii]
MASSTNPYPQAPGWDPKKTPFPQARRCDKVFIHKSQEQGEVKVPDPYHYLEQPPSQSEETKAFCEAQAAFTQQYLDQCKDLKEFRQILDNVVNYPRFSTPRSVGPPDDLTYYYTFNNGLDAQSTWYKMTPEELMNAERTGYKSPPGQQFFNENLMSKDGTTTVGNFYFSHSGKIAAYTVTHRGSDWYSVYFRDTSKPFTEQPEDLKVAAKGGPDCMSDVIHHVKFSGVSWSRDDKGVFYQRLAHTDGQDQGTETAVAKDAEVWYHKLGTSQDEDILIINKDPDLESNIWGAHTTDDGKWLMVSSFKGTEQKSRLYVAPLDPQAGITADLKWISIAPEFAFYLSFITNDGDDFYFMTNKDAPNWKIVRASVNPSQAKKVEHLRDLKDEVTLEDIVKENKEATLDEALVVAQNKLLVWYVKDVKNELYQYELKTGEKIRRLLPDLLGTISSVSGRKKDNHAFLSVTSFTSPGLVYRLNWDESDRQDTKAEPKIVQHRATKVSCLDLNAFTTQQIFITSKDGTKVPVYLTHLKTRKFDGTAPAWIYAYGGFAHSLMPTFSPRLLSWIGSYDGVLAWVNARGGSEYGEDWHNAGAFGNKQNCFDDIICTAQHLVDNKIAAKGKLIVNGGSNGGLMAMAVANQAPEGLLGAVLAEVGVLDMLRFQHFTAGVFWTQEFGNPDEAEPFDYIYKYSPLHNVDANKTYPLVLLTTADHDDRVSPLHSFKQIAELQHRLPNNPQPLLLRVTMDAGHGASNSLTKLLEEAAIKYCLTAHVLGLKRQPLPGSLPPSKQ